MKANLTLSLILLALVACGKSESKKTAIQRGEPKPAGPSFQTLVEKGNNGECSSKNPELVSSKGTAIKPPDLPAGAYEFQGASYLYSMGGGGTIAQVVLVDKDIEKSLSTPEVKCSVGTEKAYELFLAPINSQAFAYGNFTVTKVKGTKLLVAANRYFVVASEKGKIKAESGYSEIPSEAQVVDLTKMKASISSASDLDNVSDTLFFKKEEGVVEVRFQQLIRSSVKSLTLIKNVVATYKLTGEKQEPKPIDEKNTPKKSDEKDEKAQDKVLE